MLTRVAQRTDTDCVIAVVAAVMGFPYTYERVLADQGRYLKPTSDGQYAAWWETYLRDEGFPNRYHSLANLGHAVSTGAIAGIVMLAPTVPGSRGHVVAVDEFGFINPATNWPERIPSLGQLLSEYIRLGCRYEPEQEFLAVDVGRNRAAVSGVRKGADDARIG
jgi:hypothetical protein